MINGVVLIGDRVVSNGSHSEMVAVPQNLKSVGLGLDGFVKSQNVTQTRKARKDNIL